MVYMVGCPFKKNTPIMLPEVIFLVFLSSDRREGLRISLSVKGLYIFIEQDWPKRKLAENGFFITGLVLKVCIMMFWFQSSSLGKEIKNNREVVIFVVV